MEQSEKRVFFGFDIESPWNETLPNGRVLEEQNRHLTLAFLGENDEEKLMQQLEELPKPPFKIGIAGKFDECLLLPNKKNPRVVAWHAHFFDHQDVILQYQKNLLQFLREKGYPIEERFKPHVTIARKPSNPEEWKEAFSQTPFFLKQLCLYESLGYSKYRRLWELPFILPFEEIEHIADIAYLVRGENLKQLHLHAKVALAFAFPPILAYFSDLLCEQFEDIVKDLNDMVMVTDREIGCGFKAVSYSGEIKTDKHNLKTWEMIIDV